ncbi:MAG: 2'-5' RNA ligase family protein [Streptosporangiaceae bacterium]
MATRDRETALIVEVPAAEPVVGRHRADLDANAGLGVPAHITILAPFVPAGRLGAPERDRLAGVFAAVLPFELRLDRTCWFGTTVLWLGPRDPAPFSDLTGRVFAAFPEYPPFGGQFDEVVPHLTVGHQRPVDELRRAEQEIIPKLPVAATVSAVTLMAESTVGGRWVTVATFPLGSAGAR